MTMLERAAKGLHDASRTSGGPTWDDLTPEERAYVVSLARAVLMAVREPDEAVMAVKEIVDIDAWWFDDAVKRAFTAMIDEILKEGET
jgi:hypothetical protein